MTDRNTADAIVKGKLEEYLKDKGINPRNPFRCLNPQHNDSNPSMSVYRDKEGTPRCHCFSCGANYSTLDLIAIDYGLSDTGEIYRKAYALFNIDVAPCKEEAPGGSYGSADAGGPQSKRNIHNNDTQQSCVEQSHNDFTQLYSKAAAAIEQTDYHRGISLATLKRFRVGFVPDWKHPKAPKMAPSPRLIIPVNNDAYIARHASKEDYINYKGEVENKSKARAVDNPSWTFNIEALRDPRQPVFIVEGELDAMSIVDVGGEAVAIGSTSYVKNFLKSLKEGQFTPSQPLIIALDNDNAGNQAAQGLEEGLKNQGFITYRLDVAAPYKDANEALNEDRESLRSRVQKVVEDPAAAADFFLKEAAREQLQKESVFTYMLDFLKDIEESEQEEYSPTGFKGLDALLDGGLYAGLYIVGAISSLGKTSFCLNIADNIAASGRDVLIFSLEMARKELIAKSVSRFTFNEAERRGDRYHKTAKTTRGILTGSRYKNYSREERNLIQTAIADYADHVTEHLFVTEGVGDVTIEKIRTTIERYIALKGRPPVVLIDYLQIIAPYDVRATDKQNTDKAVLELKRLSRDYKIPVVAISSFNRENYTAPVNMGSFKESGAIEYSSDVLIGLQYRGMDWDKEDKDEKTRNKRVREIITANITNGKNGLSQEIQVKILKNRNGSKGDCVINYWPMFNVFRDPYHHDDYEEEADF